MNNRLVENFWEVYGNVYMKQVNFLRLQTTPSPGLTATLPWMMGALEHFSAGLASTSRFCFRAIFKNVSSPW
jgi:hypothetical protein